MPRKSLTTFVAAAALVALAPACGGGDDGPGSTAPGRPSIVVTTSILGDVVANLVGELAEVETVMPAGASPHDFQASAKQVAAMRGADVLVANGAGFEEGLADAVEAAAADGVPTFEAIDAVEVLRIDGSDQVDPHFFTDPARMRTAADALVDFVAAEVPGLDAAALRQQAAAYVAELARLDTDVEGVLGAVPPEQRTLVTNHEVFAYFADRYGFEVVGAIIPGGSTQAEPSAGDLAALADVVAAEHVPAVFADTSSPARLAEALAAEVGDVQVVELFSESLGPPGSGGETYTALVRTNAQRIADALSP